MRSKYFLVYRVENLLNGKYYIGAHETYNVQDGYMGSGKLIKAAIKKHGLQNFQRRILRRCGSRKEMYAYEKKLVGKHLGRELCYNLTEGGKGGWSHVLTNPLLTQKRLEAALKGSAVSAARRLGQPGNPCSEEAKLKIGAANSVKQTGEGNSHFGKVWITHDQSQLVARVQREFVQEYLNAGWRPGRVMRYEHVKIDQLEDGTGAR